MNKQFKHYVYAENYIEFIKLSDIIIETITSFTNILNIKDEDLKDLLITIVWVNNDTKIRSIYYSLVSPLPNYPPQGRWLEYFNTINEERF